MSQIDEALANTLAMVNVARTAFGYDALSELPQAHRGISSDCLYARALSDIGVQSVGGSGEMTFSSSRVAEAVGKLWGVGNQGNMVSAPKSFAKVIGKFDSAELPHLTIDN
jgi:hypothetical protein